MSTNSQEILREGWLTKSAPTKRIWRGRWRKRWFKLHHGEIPGQYVLSYYADRSSRKLKGFIDLDRCEQVDYGLKFEDKKQKYDFMFDIKTPTRTYYLAAETESDMTQWVNCICNLCGLKATSDEEDVKYEEQPNIVTRLNGVPTDSPPISPVSTSPYIPISECITGKMPILPNQSLKDFNILLQQNMKSYCQTRNHSNDTYEFTTPTYLNCDSQFYDCPRSMHPPPSHQNHKINNLNRSQDKPNYCNFHKNINHSPLQSPTDSESVFTDDEWMYNTRQIDHSNKNLRPSNSSADIEISRLKLSGENVKMSEVHIAPPRPPKPSHINTNTGASYLNLQSTVTSKDDLSKSGNHSKSNSTSDETNTVIITDEMYDFPRSHNTETPPEVRNTLNRRHCYNNAAPSVIEGQVFTYDDPSPKPSTSNAQVFQYGDEIDEPASPISQGSSTAPYSNLPSPLLPDTQLMPPPKVNRGLKPKRKLSDSVSISSNPEPPSPQFAPSVDRKLKPPSISGTMPSFSRRIMVSDDESIFRLVRAAPSPTPPGLGRSYESLMDENEMTYPGFGDQRKILEYLDLDLENKANNQKHSKKSHIEPLRSPGAITVYKKVDFMKTEAFNITRSNLEKEREKTVPTLKK